MLIIKFSEADNSFKKIKTAVLKGDITSAEKLVQ